ncbi:glycosyl hydrolase [Streptomyces fulvorobeus]|uniref:glycosyl hydrolase n=1 Tax=Streptomyces fulvorobeus TaxID=284028 RepID=UPI002113A912|nr:glycosyl hydrolase [Streptomyces fulvorobeus]
MAVLTGLLIAASLPAMTAHARTEPSAAVTVIEAEDGELRGVTVASTAPGFSGAGYVEGFDTAEDEVTLTIPDSPGGLHDLTVHYRGPFGSKVTSLLLNGEGAGDVPLPESHAFTTADAGRLLLRPGDNTVTLRSNWGWYQIDGISISPTPPRGPHQVHGTPVDPRATPGARSLLRYLSDNYGEHTLSGQQDMDSLAWVEEHVGRTPAVAGLDMMDFSPSRVERGASSKEVEHALAWHARGGVTAFVWHWNAPAGLIDEPGKEWWRGFYTDATTFDLAAALANPSSAEYRLLIRDIDAVAAQLSRLQDAGIPVLWRPLHEAEGGWFWWGAKGPGPAKELYRLMYDRMVGHHGLHNLLWVWNSLDPEWYPGDDVVDIVSADTYPPAGDHSAQSGAYERLVELVGDKKPVALSENGPIPDPDLTRAYQAHWSYFTTWSGGFVKDGVSNSREHLKHVYGHRDVITLDELGDFTRHGGCRADWEVVGAWGEGHLVKVTVTNDGDEPLSGWRTGANRKPGTALGDHWNARVDLTPGGWSAVNLGWNAALEPGDSTSFYLRWTAAEPAASSPALSCQAR